MFIVCSCAITVVTVYGTEISAVLRWLEEVHCGNLMCEDKGTVCRNWNCRMTITKDYLYTTTETVTPYPTTSVATTEATTMTMVTTTIT